MEEAFSIDYNETLLLYVAGGLFLVQVIYYTSLYLRIPRRRKAVEQDNLAFQTDCPPLSVILYARESCEELKRNLPALLAQDYPTFEVIIITDGTDDGTVDYLNQLQNQYSNLYHSFIPNSSRYISHKKLGLTLGIKASKYDWLVMTDPDCTPNSAQWLRLLARNFTPDTDIVLGYSGYDRGKGWLAKRIAYDNLFQAMRYLGFALGGHPYTGIGKNLAYRKELFYKNKGFSEHLNLLRGDDDLFINRVTTRSNTRVETDIQSVMRRLPCKRAKDWREEKIGRTSTARLHQGWQHYAAGLETTTRLLFHITWTGTLVLGVLQRHWIVASLAFAFFLLRLVLQMWTVNKNAQVLGEPRRYYTSLPVFDFLQPLQSLRWKFTCTLRKKSEFQRK